MLELKDIKKYYNVGGNITRALDGVSAAFREKEFVAILGMSGSGKTTFLNIIGGLDRYDSGELIIKGKQTKSFKDSEWDAYRNNSIGFVFQTYNLIMHLSIVANVEIGMTLSGVSSAEKRKRALEVLEQVGLSEHLHKKPNQLSGGQMQRVAIARALANNPEILLCDEPTGALDTTTSMQIMDLIKEVAKDRLVIMVTHNPSIAEKYADRIINFQDGKIISDSHPHIERPKEDMFNLKRTSMSFFTALRLSFNNIRTKKGRTFLTSFASSIGIIGIAVILSLSTGFKTTIDDFQRDTLAEFPILITQTSSSVNMEEIETLSQEMQNRVMGSEEYTPTDKVYLYDPSTTRIVHTNVLSDEYLDYVKALDPAICSSIGFTRLANMNMIRNADGEIVPVSLSGAANSQGGSSGGAGGMMGMSSMGISSYPTRLTDTQPTYLEKNYDVLLGEYPQSPTDLVLVIDTKNRINYAVLERLGFETENVESIALSDIVGTEFTIVSNNNYYVKTEFGTYLPGTDYEGMQDKDGNIPVRICGVVRQKEGVSMGILSAGIAYGDELVQMVIDSATESEIVKAQKDSDLNVMSMEQLTESAKNSFVAYLGGDATPYMMMIYPVDFNAKDELIDYLNAYNTDKKADDQIIFTDLAGTMSSMTGGIMDGITIVLVAFAAISLVVSLVMISIITYTSVLERTKEIGILRSLGARKKDITRVFDAETTILGIFSGILGVVLAWLATFPINVIIFRLTDLHNVAHLQLTHAIMLVIISTILTVLGGHIPARMASRRDAVEALRSE